MSLGSFPSVQSVLKKFSRNDASGIDEERAALDDVYRTMQASPIPEPQKVSGRILDEKLLSGRNLKP